MDISAQIKDDLISRIKNSDNLDFLRTLQTLFDASEQSLFSLSNQQKDSIEEGREQIRNGRFHTNESVLSEMKEWLSKK
ncbi:hypothetical protein GR160_16400 [Flavobacterium sp. Sd200]|uniref:hypothetical protein n=1 Tax=Flavobacterium sp. Sd200 TaxID=2692211 RepID=UPI00136B1847|nr:hypothetical protein [Flavobacterium sp. Sd200]MXN92809.1 hypothetical protein [Flavobacterium sp. Sd200]